MASRSRNKLNNLSPKEWTQKSASVIEVKNLSELYDELISIYSKSTEIIGILTYEASTKAPAIENRHIITEKDLIQREIGLLIMNILPVLHISVAPSLKS